MKSNFLHCFFVLFLLAGISLLHNDTTAEAYGEVSLTSEVTTADETLGLNSYIKWAKDWDSILAESTGNVILTPGSTTSDLNFAWYSEDSGTPAVMISEYSDFSYAKTVTGSATAIERSNGVTTYYAANHVAIKKFFSPNKTYYYRYTDAIEDEIVHWSEIYTYKTHETGSFSVILTSDPQIGGSTSLPADTYSWNRTLEQAVKTCPDASFILAAGDQIDFKKEMDDANLRESEYAGLLYPSLLRTIPFVTVIGNHDTKVGDYQYHFYNTNTTGNYGSTPAGSDYYFRYGDVLFIILNSNSRDTSSHRQLMKRAIKANSDAKWRIVSFHHDVYGSGAAHSNRTSANMRIIMAPLMDEFNIDLVINGHDHAYARSYSMLDGTAIDYGNQSVSLKNPVGTTYISLGTATGCKMFALSATKQFYVAERSNDPVPTYSTLDVTANSLTVKTYDYNGEKYADDFVITKTKTKKNPLTVVNAAKKLKKKNYTIDSYNNLQNALNLFQKTFQQTDEDLGALEVEDRFWQYNDPLTYYGYAYGTTDALGDGYSTLLDKTRLTCLKLSSQQFQSAYKSVTAAKSGLVKTSLTVKKGKKTLKNNTTLTLEKGKKLTLKVSCSPSNLQPTYSSSAKKYVSVSKNGVIKAKKITPKKGKKKTVLVTVKFQNRTFKVKIRVKKASDKKKNKTSAKSKKSKSSKKD